MSAALFTAYLQYRQDCFKFHQQLMRLRRRSMVMHFYWRFGDNEHHRACFLPATTVATHNNALQIEVTRPALDGEQHAQIQSGTE